MDDLGRERTKKMTPVNDLKLPFEKLHLCKVKKRLNVTSLLTSPLPRDRDNEGQTKTRPLTSGRHRESSIRRCRWHDSDYKLKNQKGSKERLQEKEKVFEDSGSNLERRT